MNFMLFVKMGQAMLFNRAMAKSGRLNEWIVDRLRAVKATQSDLARALNVAPPAINALVEGGRQLQIHELPAFCRALQISTDQAVNAFLTHELPEEAEAPPTDIEHFIREAVVGILHATLQRGIPPEQKADLVLQLYRKLRSDWVDPNPPSAQWLDGFVLDALLPRRPANQD